MKGGRTGREIKTSKLGMERRVNTIPTSPDGITFKAHWTNLYILNTGMLAVVFGTLYGSFALIGKVCICSSAVTKTYFDVVC